MLLPWNGQTRRDAAKLSFSLSTLQASPRYARGGLSGFYVWLGLAGIRGHYVSLLSCRLRCVTWQLDVVIATSTAPNEQCEYPLSERR